MKPARAAEAGGAIHAGLCQEYRTESGRVGTGAANCSSSQDNPLPATDSLMELVVARDNMIRARKRVCANKGAPGIDARTTDDLKTLSREHWSLIRGKLLSGTYRPDPVKRVEIPKPNGGTRLLGIPTVMDRLIQQAICQILTPVFDPLFSDHSYGFRPGRSARQAVLSAQSFQRNGRRFVVDMDLKAFLDPSTYYTPSHAAFSRCKSKNYNAFMGSCLRFSCVKASEVLLNVFTR